jgi:uncharacterized membrane protein
MSIIEAAGIVLLILLLETGFVCLLYMLTPHGIELESILIGTVVMVGTVGGLSLVLYFLFKRYAHERTLRVAMLTLSPDEQKVLKEILVRKEVRQDDLRRIVDMSKAKLSMIVNNLERKGAIHKLRYHKTNILRVTKEFSG